MTTERIQDQALLHQSFNHDVFLKLVSGELEHLGIAHDSWRKRASPFRTGRIVRLSNFVPQEQRQPGLYSSMFFLSARCAAVVITPTVRIVKISEIVGPVYAAIDVDSVSVIAELMRLRQSGEQPSGDWKPRADWLEKTRERREIEIRNFRGSNGPEPIHLAPWRYEPEPIP